MQTYHDDDYEAYVNGTLIDSATGWTTQNEPVKKEIPTSFLHNGINVIAVHIQQNWGDAYFDCGISYVDVADSQMKVTVPNGRKGDMRNIQGQKVDSTYKGIIIQNGRKVLNR